MRRLIIILAAFFFLAIVIEIYFSAGRYTNLLLRNANIEQSDKTDRKDIKKEKRM